MTDSALSDILTQEEIDALLEPQSSSQSIPNNLIKTATPPHRYPVLENNMEAFERSFLRHLSQITQCNSINMSIQSFITGQMGGYLDTLPSPSILGFYQVNEWKQPILINFDSALSYCLVDMSLGGRRGTSALPLNGRAYTCIERNILQNILSSLINDLDSAFDKHFYFEGLDTNPKTALITSPACEIIITRFEIEINKQKGIVDIILPAYLISEIEISEEKDENIANFSENLARAVSKTPLEIKAVLDSKQISFKEISSWKIGDVLPLHYYEDKPLVLTSAGKNLFKGKIQVQNKTINIQVLSKKKDS